MGESAQEHADYLNQLVLLLDFEVSRKLPEKTLFPIGVICARAFTLIEGGHLTWGQFLTKGSDYHFFSGESDERGKAMEKVSTLYRERVSKRVSPQMQKSIKEWKEKRPYSVVVATAEEMHQELLEQYGGGYESEGEAYPDGVL